MKFFSGLIIVILFFIISPGFGQLNDGDTLVVQAVTWEYPSPEGWGASYKEMVKFPENEGPWAKILMVQQLKTLLINTLIHGKITWIENVNV